MLPDVALLTCYAVRAVVLGSLRINSFNVKV